MTTSSRSLIHHLAPYLSAQIRPNSRLLSSLSALHEAQLSSLESTSPRWLIHRLAPYLSAQIRPNSRLLSTSSALHEAQVSSSESPSPSTDAVHLTDNCVRRMKELQAEEPSKKLLRLSIEAGGCSGFQYNFSLDDKTNNDDRIFEQDGVKLVVDNISFDFVKGATVDYVDELIRSAFQVSTNPSAVGGCSCKSSFMVK